MDLDIGIDPFQHLRVPDRRHVVAAGGAHALGNRKMLLAGQLELLEMRAPIRARDAADELVPTIELELDRIGTGLNRQVTQLERVIVTALVIAADLSDEESGILARFEMIALSHAFVSMERNRLLGLPRGSSCSACRRLAA